MRNGNHARANGYGWRVEDEEEAGGSEIVELEEEVARWDGMIAKHQEVAGQVNDRLRGLCQVDQKGDLEINESGLENLIQFDGTPERGAAEYEDYRLTKADKQFFTNFLEEWQRLDRERPDYLREVKELVAKYIEDLKGVVGREVSGEAASAFRNSAGGMLMVVDALEMDALARETAQKALDRVKRRKETQ